MPQNQTPLPCALVIEDDDHIGQLLQFMLERESYRVHLARDGRAGKTFIENEPPPAIALGIVEILFVIARFRLRRSRIVRSPERAPTGR